MTLQALAFTQAIANLSFTGVTVKNLNEVSAQVSLRGGPVLQPVTDGPFITNFTVTRDTFGEDDTAKKTARYTLNYRLYFLQVGAERAGGLAKYQDFISLIFHILDVLIANSNISIDLTPPDSFQMGILTDPSGVQYHACDFPIGVEEYIN